MKIFKDVGYNLEVEIEAILDIILFIYLFIHFIYRRLQF